MSTSLLYERKTSTQSNVLVLQRAIHSFPAVCLCRNRCSAASHGVLARPLASTGLVLLQVVLVNVCDLRNQRVIWPVSIRQHGPSASAHTRVGVCQQRANREEHFRDGESRAPLLPKNIQTNSAIAVDVRVVDPRREVHLIGRSDGARTAARL